MCYLRVVTATAAVRAFTVLPVLTSPLPTLTVHDAPLPFTTADFTMPQERDDDGHGQERSDGRPEGLPAQVLGRRPGIFDLCLRADAFELADGDGAL